MRLTHLGHACLLAETDGARILFDPGTMSRFDEVRDVSIVVVTHQHVRAVRPRVAVPIHEGEATDPAKYAGMLAAFSPEGVVRPLAHAEAAVL